MCYVTFNEKNILNVWKSHFSLLTATYKIKSFFRKNIILACTFIFLSTDLYSLFTIRQMELPSFTTVDVTIWLTQISLLTHIINPLSPELNPICYLLALLWAHYFLHVSRIRVKSLTFRRLMSYIYIWSTHSWCF